MKRIALLVVVATLILASGCKVLNTERTQTEDPKDQKPGWTLFRRDL